MSMSQAEKLAQIIEEARSVALIRMSTAPLSFLASIAILILIARSEKKLTTTQNRLLVGLSISDVISSFATAFATTPMPKETTYYVWSPLGNTSTCEAQGFLYILGGLVTPCYNAAICVFFFLKIKYDMDDDTIRKRVEPFLHGVPIVYGLTFSTYCLVNEYINASRGLCFVNDFPIRCSKNPNVPCQRGENFDKDRFVIFVSAFQFFVIPFIIFGTMLTIYLTVLQQEHRMSRYGVGSLSPAARNSTTTTRRRDNRYVRMTMYRGLAYSGAWFAVWIFPFIQVMQNLTSDNLSSFELRVLVAIFYPLQGVSNFGVYIYPKIMEVRRLDPEQSVLQAFIFVLKTSGSVQAELTRRRRRLARTRQQASMIVRSVNDVPENIVEIERIEILEEDGVTTSSPAHTESKKSEETNGQSTMSLHPAEEEEV